MRARWKAETDALPMDESSLTFAKALSFVLSSSINRRVLITNSQTHLATRKVSRDMRTKSVHKSVAFHKSDTLRLYQKFYGINNVLSGKSMSDYVNCNSRLRGDH